MPTNLYQSRPSTLALEARTGRVGLEDAVYINTTDSLEVSIVSSVGCNPSSSNPPAQGIQVCIDVRMLTTSSGLIYQTFMVNPTNDYQTNFFQIKLPEGFLLNANAYTMQVVQPKASGMNSAVELPLLGQTWCALSVVNSNNPSLYTGTFLCQGYITNNQRINYPVPQDCTYDDGAPFTRIQVGPLTPPVNYFVPLHAIDEITGVQAVLNTDATTGSRQPSLIFFQNMGATLPRGSDVYLLVPMMITAGPSQRSFLTWGQGYPVQDIAVWQGGNALLSSLPIRYRMRNGGYLQLQIAYQGPGDTLENLTVWGNEWLVP